MKSVLEDARCGGCGFPKSYPVHNGEAMGVLGEDEPLQPHEWTKPRRRSSRPCPDCGHDAKDHYGPEGDPYNGESGCAAAWQCKADDVNGPAEYDGCRCEWDGRPKARVA